MQQAKLHVVYAHPYPTRSISSRALLEVFLQRKDVSVHALYDLYPDGDIDVQAEQAALSATQNIVWLAPLYWYSVPALMKQWFDQVLTRGWAYGREGKALVGRRCLWVTTTGGHVHDYSNQGMHQRPFEDFIAPIEQTARFCGMDWQPPFVVHGAHQQDAAQREATRHALAVRVEEMVASAGRP